MVSYINRQGGLSSKKTPLHTGEEPFRMDTLQPALTEGSACAGQTEPGSRLAVLKHCLLGRVNAPPPSSLEYLENLHCPIYFFKEQGCAVPLFPILLRRDLLSQVNRTIWHLQPELWALHLWPLDGSLQTSPRRFRAFQRIEHNLQDASMLLSGQSSPLGAQPTAKTHLHATYL